MACRTVRCYHCGFLFTLVQGELFVTSLQTRHIRVTGSLHIEALGLVQASKTQIVRPRQLRTGIKCKMRLTEKCELMYLPVP